MKRESQGDDPDATTGLELFSVEGVDPLDPVPKPELVFGIVGPVGVDRKDVCDALENELHHYEYETVPIKISSLIEEISGYEKIAPSIKDEYSRILNYMSAGTQIRETSKLGDALAILAVSEISENRAEINKEKGRTYKDVDLSQIGIQKVAYILDSLKHPDEIHLLRAIYGRAFFVISAHSDRDKRVDNLSRRIANTRFRAQKAEGFRFLAEKLVSRDEKEEGKPLGQNVEKTFPLSDVFIDMDNENRPFEHEIRRFVSIIFGNPFATPSKDESGMFQAEASSCRSADLARQVGASICSKAGEVLALGCNEVPRALGGLYWEDDVPDGRDFRRGIDEGTRQKRLMVAQILERFRESGLANSKKTKELDELIEKATAGAKDDFLDDLQALSVLEYGRTVHAEMAALSDAAKRGVSTAGTTMYVNTFPCHICARHIIAAGIERLVYIEPYPKSLTARLFDDSVVVGSSQAKGRRIRFEPFSGVAPRVYDFSFKHEQERKNDDGTPKNFDKRTATTKFKRFVSSYIIIESNVIKDLLPKIKNTAKIKVPDEGGEQ